MWTKSATRKELLGIFQSPPPWDLGDIQQSDLLVPWFRNPGDVFLIWPDNPRERPMLPATVVVARESQRDFLAWAMTYLPNVRPFTAFCRVVDPDMANKVGQRRGKAWLGELQDACLGVILGEAGTYLERQPGRVSLSICRSTFSFSMARSLALGAFPAEDDDIGRAWFTVRNVTNQPRLTLGRELLEGVWSVLRALRGDGELPLALQRPSVPVRIVESCLDLYRTGEIQSQRWQGVTNGVAEVNEARERMKGPLESRVVSLERALGILSSQRINDRTTASFISGYLASQVSPGTIDHIGLLVPFLPQLPGALLWCGLCAGLQQRSSLLNHGGGLGRRILQEALRNDSMLDEPHCDIALAELEILIKAESQLFELRTLNPGQLEVEIAPCVNTVLRWPTRGEKEMEMIPSRDKLENAQTVFAQLTESLDRATSTSRRLARIFGLYERPRGRDDRKDRR